MGFMDLSIHNEIIEKNKDKRIKLKFPEDFSYLNGKYIFLDENEVCAIYKKDEYEGIKLCFLKEGQDLYLTIDIHTNNIVSVLDEDNYRYSFITPSYEETELKYNDISNCLKIPITIKTKIKTLSTTLWNSMSLRNRIIFNLKTNFSTISSLLGVENVSNIKINIDGDFYDSEVYWISNINERYSSEFTGDVAFIFLFEKGYILSIYKSDSYDNLEYGSMHSHFATSLFLNDSIKPLDLTDSIDSVYPMFMISNSQKYDWKTKCIIKYIKYENTNMLSNLMYFLETESQSEQSKQSEYKEHKESSFIALKFVLEKEVMNIKDEGYRDSAEHY